METCDKCIHCTHYLEDMVGRYYYCSLEKMYIEEKTALNEEAPCPDFIQSAYYDKKLDDNQTKESSA